MSAVRAKKGDTMQVASPRKADELHKPSDLAADQSRMLLWASAGLLETICLLGGLYWIMIADDPRPLALRVVLVSALAVVLGVASLVVYARISRQDS